MNDGARVLIPNPLADDDERSHSASQGRAEARMLEVGKDAVKVALKADKVELEAEGGLDEEPDSQHVQQSIEGHCASITQMHGVGSLAGQFYVVVSALQTFALLITNPLGWPEIWLSWFGWAAYFSFPLGVAFSLSPGATFAGTLLVQPLLVAWFAYRVWFFHEKNKDKDKDKTVTFALVGARFADPKWDGRVRRRGSGFGQLPLVGHILGTSWAERCFKRCGNKRQWFKARIDNDESTGVWQRTRNRWVMLTLVPGFAI
eukprot:SAG11_NODE_6508_length_1300_cov_1.363031_1_plen_259_part_10